ncbi:hypothetical protein BJ138DRAFT_1191346 [Hygrophoropsis aurantiaca]|uniref:Uncharacterized protein n=1 Tax=Hygrophoropsis aurantiaca TaxID=72124 RepID=A0ACB7ZS16_9AGAM|nr:hypothetical protein BJ138DRAFT_1191346 [Hygrophoropsis aurantiaca]
MVGRGVHELIGINDNGFVRLTIFTSQTSSPKPICSPSTSKYTSMPMCHFNIRVQAYDPPRVGAGIMASVNTAVAGPSVSMAPKRRQAAELPASRSWNANEKRSWRSRQGVSTGKIRTHAITDKYPDLLVVCTPGWNGAKHIKAVTLQNILTHLIHCIVKFCKDAKGNATGMDLLIQCDLFSQLEQQAAQFVTILTTYYTTARPGSLGPSHSDFARQGKYLKLHDIKLYLVAPFSWQGKITLRNLKGYNDIVSLVVENVLDPVENSQNVIFDWAMWVVRLEDLLSSRESELHILPEKLDEPFFLKADWHGLKLCTDPPLPATANSISQGIHFLAMNAGLPGGNSGAIRRDAGNNYGIKLGASYAQLLMAHQESNTTFNRYYSKGTGNLALTAIRNGEIQFDGTIIKQSLALNDFCACAVLALVNIRLDNVENPPEHPETISRNPTVARDTRTINTIKLDPAHKDEIEHHNLLIEFEEARVKAWAAFIGCFSAMPKKKPYQPLMSNVTQIEQHKTIRRLDTVTKEQLNAKQELDTTRSGDTFDLRNQVVADLTVPLDVCKAVEGHASSVQNMSTRIGKYTIHAATAPPVAGPSSVPEDNVAALDTPLAISDDESDDAGGQFGQLPVLPGIQAALTQDS